MTKSIRGPSSPASAKTKDADIRRKILTRAVVDPEFRKRLLKNPESVFGGKLTKTDVAAMQRLKVTLPAIDNIVTSLAGEVLCGSGGGCGGLA
jgi:hypothetical protein